MLIYNNFLKNLLQELKKNIKNMTFIYVNCCKYYINHLFIKLLFNTQVNYRKSGSWTYEYHS